MFLTYLSKKCSNLKHERVHAWVGEAILPYFDKILKEDGLYEINKFVVKYSDNTERNPFFEGGKYIILSNLTEVVLLNESHFNIPFNVWKFTNLAGIAKLDKNFNHFIGNIKMSNFPFTFFI